MIFKPKGKMLLAKISNSVKEIVIMIKINKIIIKTLIYQRPIQIKTIIIFICKIELIKKATSFRKKKKVFS